MAIDPLGSVLAKPNELNAQPSAEGGQIVEGIGYDFIPRVCDRDYTDHWIKAPDKETFIMARRLMREEGLMCGGSSGTAMWAALKYIKENNIGEGKRCVVILPDNIRNYITKHLSTDWMYEKGYIDEQECIKLNTSDLVPNKDWGQDLKVVDLNLAATQFLNSKMKVGELLAMMNSSPTQAYVVANDDGKILGSVTKAQVMTKLVKKSVTQENPIADIVIRDIRHISGATSVNELARVLARTRYALVDKKALVSADDFLQFMAAKIGAQPAKVAQPEEAPKGMSYFKIAGLGLVTAGIATGALMLAKHKQ